MGLIIYQPSGKAKEYSPWAANFYNGCPGCTYCYNKKGRFSKVLGGETPTIKKSLGSEENAFRIFKKELNDYLPLLRQEELFFNFVSDPCLKETFDLNWKCINECLINQVPVKILTKQTWWIEQFMRNEFYYDLGEKLKIGFSITGFDKEEPGCATTEDRIYWIRQLNYSRYYVWTSFEPVIDPFRSTQLIYRVKDICNHFKIGLLSGKKYERQSLLYMKTAVENYIKPEKIYWKESFLNQIK